VIVQFPVTLTTRIVRPPPTRRLPGLAGQRLQDGTAPPVFPAASRPLTALQSAQNSAGIQTLLDVSASDPLQVPY
jgi:hypothetical protein